MDGALGFPSFSPLNKMVEKSPGIEVCGVLGDGERAEGADDVDAYADPAAPAVY